MFELSGAELVGYLASALVVVSLAMTSVVRLRMVSLAGSITFVVYGTLIDSVPIMITNGSIAVINVWFLRKEFRSGAPHGRDLGVSHIRPDSPFLADFIAFHLIDIHRFQPDFRLPTGDDVVTLLLNYKSQLHKMIDALRAEELRAGLQLLLISVVALPLLPNQGYGPWQSLNPYVIWWLVVLIAAIS